MKGTDKILQSRSVHLPGINMLIVKAKDVKTPLLIKAPRLKLVLFCRGGRPPVAGVSSVTAVAAPNI